MTTLHIHIEIKKTIGLFPTAVYLTFSIVTLSLKDTRCSFPFYPVEWPCHSHGKNLVFRPRCMKGHQLVLMGTHGINRKRIWAAAKLGKVEITVQRKITDQALYGYDKSFADTSSVSCRVFSCHRRSQAKFNVVLTVAMGPVHDSWGTASCAKVISQIEENELFLY